MLLTGETEAILSGLADLKRSLLRSFAVGLHKCADLMLYLAGPIGPRSSKPITRVTPAREEEEGLPDDGPAGMNGVGPGGPPKHWAELVKSVPPPHWVELVRRSAPELLSEADDDGTISRAADGPAYSPVAQTPQPESTGLKSESAPSPQDRGQSGRPKPMPLLLARRAISKRQRETSHTSKPLLRPMSLRAQPAKKPDGATAARRSELDSKREPEHITTAREETDETAVGQSALLPAPESPLPDNAAEDASLMTTEAESMGPNSGRRGSRGTPALDSGGRRTPLPSSSPGVRRAGAVYPGRSQARTGLDGKARGVGDDYMDASSAKARAPHMEGGRDADRREISAPRISERVAPQAFVAHVEAPHRAQTVFDEEKGSRAQALRAREEVKGRAGSADLEPARPSKRAEELSARAQARDFQARDFYVPRAAHGAVAPHQGQAADAPALMYEKTPNEAESVRQSVRAPGQSSEKPWPDLPAAPPPELADEVSALEDELRRGRRLEREQRGMWWNA